MSLPFWLHGNLVESLLQAWLNISQIMQVKFLNRFMDCGYPPVVHNTAYTFVYFGYATVVRTLNSYTQNCLQLCSFKTLVHTWLRMALSSMTPIDMASLDTVQRHNSPTRHSQLDTVRLVIAPLTCHFVHDTTRLG